MKISEETKRVECVDESAVPGRSTKYPPYASSITLMKMMDGDTDYMMNDEDGRASSITRMLQK